MIGNKKEGPLVLCRPYREKKTLNDTTHPGLDRTAKHKILSYIKIFAESSEPKSDSPKRSGRAINAKNEDLSKRHDTFTVHKKTIEATGRYGKRMTGNIKDQRYEIEKKMWEE